jgi:peptidyl-dipeptidase Dcp
LNWEYIVKKADLFKTNPLFWALDGSTNFIPVYDHIKPEHFLPAIDYAVAEARRKLGAIKRNKHAPTLQNTLHALEDSYALLEYFHAIFTHLSHVKTSPELQALAEVIDAANSNFQAEIWQDKILFKRVKTLYNNKDKIAKTKADKVAIGLFYDFFQTLIDKLPVKTKKRLTEIEKELNQLHSLYDKNLEAAQNNLRFIVDKKEDLSGIPEIEVNAAAEHAKKLGVKGWAFTGAEKTRGAILKYADKRHIREEYTIAINRMATEPPYDNLETFKKVLILCYEAARANGSASHATYTLNGNMLFTRKSVYDFLNSLKEPILRGARKDKRKLAALALLDGVEKFESWDEFYYLEKFRKHALDFTTEELGQYFQTERVVRTALDCLEILFNLKIEKNTTCPRLSIDIECYDVRDAETGEKKATISFDLYLRPGKNDNSTCSALFSHGTINDVKVVPPINMLFNFTKPALGEPVLLNFDEVKTIFHELGHAVHELLGELPYRSLSGISCVIKDFKELPSQMFENWALMPEVLDKMACHWQTGEPMPAAMKEKLRTKNQFMGGFQRLIDLKRSYLDLELYSYSPKKIDVRQFERERLKDIFKTFARGPLMSARFNHIVSLGLDANYSNYLFSEALDADGFQLFEEKGIFDPETAAKFKYLLSHSTLDFPDKTYKEYRGREFSSQAWLARYGLLPKPRKSFAKVSALTSGPEQDNSFSQRDSSSSPGALDIT